MLALGTHRGSSLCVLAGLLAHACGGLTDAEVNTTGSGGDVPAADAAMEGAPRPSTDAAPKPEAAAPDASSCFDVASGSTPACLERPVVACPLSKGSPSVAHAVKTLVTACRTCIGSWTCGSLSFEVDADGCTTPPIFSHPGNEPFMACVRTAMGTVRFDCAEGLDAQAWGVGIDSCTK